jgi:hypothetical protein
MTSISEESFNDFIANLVSQVSKDNKEIKFFPEIPSEQYQELLNLNTELTNAKIVKYNMQDFLVFEIPNGKLHINMPENKILPIEKKIIIHSGKEDLSIIEDNIKTLIVQENDFIIEDVKEEVVNRKNSHNSNIENGFLELFLFPQLSFKPSIINQSYSNLVTDYMYYSFFEFLKQTNYSLFTHNMTNSPSHRKLQEIINQIYYLKNLDIILYDLRKKLGDKCPTVNFNTTSHYFSITQSSSFLPTDMDDLSLDKMMSILNNLYSPSMNLRFEQLKKIHSGNYNINDITDDIIRLIITNYLNAIRNLFYCMNYKNNNTQNNFVKQIEYNNSTKRFKLTYNTQISNSQYNSESEINETIYKIYNLCSFKPIKTELHTFFNRKIQEFIFYYIIFNLINQMIIQNNVTLPKDTNKENKLLFCLHIINFKLFQIINQSNNKYQYEIDKDSPRKYSEYITTNETEFLENINSIKKIQLILGLNQKILNNLNNKSSDLFIDLTYAEYDILKEQLTNIHRNNYNNLLVDLNGNINKVSAKQKLGDIFVNLSELTNSTFNLED